MPLPQTPSDSDLLVGQLDWAHRNINNNLDFVPDDKLNWKPAPEAKSVLDIINHAAGTVNYFTSLLQEKAPNELPTATERQAAKALITQVVEAHQSFLPTLTPADGAEIIKTPVGDLPKAIIAGLPVVELINHHGQITYIQSLLGDDKSHLLVP